jgi:hypothetical protein
MTGGDRLPLGQATDGASLVDLLLPEQALTCRALDAQASDLVSRSHEVTPASCRPGRRSSRVLRPAVTADWSDPKISPNGVASSSRYAAPGAYWG